MANYLDMYKIIIISNYNLSDYNKDQELYSNKAFRHVSYTLQKTGAFNNVCG